MSEEELNDQPFDWDEWPERRAELTAALDRMRGELAGIDPRPELDNLRAAGEKFMHDMDNAIAAGDAEYIRLHPGTSFEHN